MKLQELDIETLLSVYKSLMVKLKHQTVKDAQDIKLAAAIQDEIEKRLPNS